MATATLPGGTAAYDVGYYPYPPECCEFYASAAHVVDGGPDGNLVLEFDAISGQPVAAADHGPVTESVAGSAVGAGPHGGWELFRPGLPGPTLPTRPAHPEPTAATPAGNPAPPATRLFPSA